MKQRTALTLCYSGVAMLLAGCYSTSQVSRDQIVPGIDYDISEVVTATGDTVSLKEVSGKGGIIKDSIIVGIREDGKVVKIPLSHVQSVKHIYFDVGEMVLAVLGITAGVILVMFWVFVRGG